jgi:hypothetical protein
MVARARAAIERAGPDWGAKLFRRAVGFSP